MILLFSLLGFNIHITYCIMFDLFLYCVFEWNFGNLRVFLCAIFYFFNLHTIINLHDDYLVIRQSSSKVQTIEHEQIANHWYRFPNGIEEYVPWILINPFTIKKEVGGREDEESFRSKSMQQYIDHGGSCSEDGDEN